MKLLTHKKTGMKQIPILSLVFFTSLMSLHNLYGAKATLAPPSFEIQNKANHSIWIGLLNGQGQDKRVVFKKPKEVKSLERSSDEGAIDISQATTLLIWRSNPSESLIEFKDRLDEEREGLIGTPYFVDARRRDQQRIKQKEKEEAEREKKWENASEAERRTWAQSDEANFDVDRWQKADRTYTFTPGKTMYLTWDKENFVRPQTGKLGGLAGKTETGFSLKNNVKLGDITG